MNVKRIFLVLLLVLLMAAVIFAQSRSTGDKGVIVTVSLSGGGNASMRINYTVENTNDYAVSVEIQAKFRTYYINSRSVSAPNNIRTEQIVVQSKSKVNYSPRNEGASAIESVSITKVNRI